ncbi:MAG: hypothetical protein N3G21_07375 [Candidatus Hydrogenedentes bacterium]|nr:hypothetical protein [Candidatus Hydrogenedentota bacterium]
MANAYPAKSEVIQTETVTKVATKNELIKYLPKGANLKAISQFSHTHLSGNNFNEGVVASPKDLKDVNTIQIKGKDTTTPTEAKKM